VFATRWAAAGDGDDIIIVFSLRSDIAVADGDRLFFFFFVYITPVLPPRYTGEGVRACARTCVSGLARTPLSLYLWYV